MQSPAPEACFQNPLYAAYAPHLGLDVDKVIPLEDGGRDELEVLAAAKIVAAHYRKLSILRWPSKEGVRFVATGVEWDAGDEPVDALNDEDEEEDDTLF